MESFEEWLFKEQKNKATWWNNTHKRQNLTAYEKENLEKVYGKLEMIEAVMKKLGYTRKERQKQINEVFSK